MRHEDLWELYESGQFLALVEGFDDAESLDMFKTAMYENAIDAGVPEGLMQRELDEAHYEMARKYSLDEREALDMSRKTMEQFDRTIMADILKEEIRGIIRAVDRHRAAQGQG